MPLSLSKGRLVSACNVIIAMVDKDVCEVWHLCILNVEMSICLRNFDVSVSNLVNFIVSETPWEWYFLCADRVRVRHEGRKNRSLRAAVSASHWWYVVILRNFVIFLFFCFFAHVSATTDLSFLIQIGNLQMRWRRARFVWAVQSRQRSVLCFIRVSSHCCTITPCNVFNSNLELLLVQLWNHHWLDYSREFVEGSYWLVLSVNRHVDIFRRKIHKQCLLLLNTKQLRRKLRLSRPVPVVLRRYYLGDLLLFWTWTLLLISFELLCHSHFRSERTCRRERLAHWSRIHTRFAVFTELILHTTLRIV